MSGQGTWESTLQGRDLDGNLSTFEAYYDTSLNITWLADANVAGGMDWTTASTWAAGLNPYGSNITGWRLPTTNDVGNDGVTYGTNSYQGVDAGYNITAYSELSHMFYTTLGDLAFFDTSGHWPQVGYGLTNSGPFSNVQSASYWSATEYLPRGNTYAWDFNTGSGQQTLDNKTINSFSAWAVHTGDVGVAVSMSTVPVPAAAWLFGSGLVGLVGMSGKRPSESLPR